MGQQQSSASRPPAPPKEQPEKNLNLKKKKRMRGPETLSKLPPILPQTKCKLRQLKLEKVRDYLVLEEGILSFQAQTAEEGAFSTERATVDKFRGYPMNLGTLEEFIDENHAIVSISTGQEYYVPIYSFVDRDALEPGCTVLLNQRESGVVGVLEGETDPLVSVMKLEKAPLETYADIGGLEQQIQEIKEAVELPLTNPELYDEMGIKPPKGVILYGAPGTGKTLLAKAVANQTSATFLRIVGSELIQKYLGEGPKLVRELFKAAEMHTPAIIFIDEIDAIGTKRYDTTSGGEKEIERTMLELLNQLDGFDTSSDIKVIMATNRIESLDPALIRPGRIDRKIEFPVPDIQTKRKIFSIHTNRMTLAKDVVLNDMIGTNEDLSGADIKAICTEAGMLALRERRKQVTMQDFIKAKEKVQATKLEVVPAALYA
ncbi:26S proteasome regulatory subunit T2 [Nematocida homosporus]|uniref:26S proteasome regulatory subunit T2 n=1 Tax=Nematocida homosporus TaxID=1912981 RepID=UPI00221F9F2A|nr:26S proteasome regulatory subunit T2 [Nematocida homosporus]KAI5186947.1 26S proteasome regulatory subunit T2 [Nematocida homosporus]